MNINNIYNRLTEFRNKKLPPKSVQLANELVKHMKKDQYSSKAIEDKALMLFNYCSDINNETKNHPKNRNAALNIITNHLNTNSNKQEIQEILKWVEFEYSNANKERIAIIEKLKEKLNDTILEKDSSASRQDTPDHSVLGQSMQSGLGIDAEKKLGSLKEQDRTNETPSIDFNKAKYLFGSSKNLTQNDLIELEFKNNNEEYSDKSVLHEDGNVKYTCHPITIELRGRNIKAKIIKQGGFDDGRKGKLKNKDVGLGAGGSKFVQTAVLVYIDPESKTEVSKKIALSTIEDPRAAKEEDRIKALLENHPNLKPLCLQPKSFTVTGKMHTNTQSKKIEEKTSKQIEISPIQTDLLNLITNTEKPLSPVQKKDISIKMLQFLSTFTKEGIVHRDIKPENLAFTEDKNIISIDNGSITKKDTPELLRTPGYVSLFLYKMKLDYPFKIPDDEITNCQQSQDAYATAHTIYNIFTSKTLPKSPIEIRTSINKIEGLDDNFKELLLDMLGYNESSPYSITMDKNGRYPIKQTFLNLFGDALNIRIEHYLNSQEQETSPP